MKYTEIELDFYPKTIIEAINHYFKDSYINIEKIRNTNFILKIHNNKYGLFKWNDDFSPDKIIRNDNIFEFLIYSIELENNLLTSTLKDNKNNILDIKENKLSKSKYLYLLNSSYNFNKQLLSIKTLTENEYNNFFLKNIVQLINLEKVLSYNARAIIFSLSSNIYQLPWQILNYPISKRGILPLFNVSSKDIISENILFLDKNYFIRPEKLFFLKENNFELNEEFWNNIKVNKAVFTSTNQLLQFFRISDFLILLAHGFRKKDFSSIKISGKFFNPFSICECDKISEVIILLCCMMNYSDSDNNLICQLIKKKVKLILSTPYIIPMEYIDTICEIISNNLFINIQELMNQILSKSFTISSLIRILI